MLLATMAGEGLTGVAISGPNCLLPAQICSIMLLMLLAPILQNKKS